MDMALIPPSDLLSTSADYEQNKQGREVQFSYTN